MATKFNRYDATTSHKHWFHYFDLTNNAASQVHKIKPWDYSRQTLYVEEFGFVCASSSATSSRPMIWDSSLSTAHKKLGGMGLKLDKAPAVFSFRLDFNDDPLVFANNNEFSSDFTATAGTGSGICFSIGAPNSAFSGWIKGYNG